MVGDVSGEDVTGQCGEWRKEWKDEDIVDSMNDESGVRTPLLGRGAADNGHSKTIKGDGC